MKNIPRELLNDSSLRGIEMLKIGKSVATGMATIALATAALASNQAHANIALTKTAFMNKQVQENVDTSISSENNSINLKKSKFGNSQSEIKFMSEDEYEFKNNALYKADLACMNNGDDGYNGALLGNISITQNGAIYVVKESGGLTNVYGDNIVKNPELQSHLDEICSGKSQDYRIGFQINTSYDTAMKFDLYVDKISHFGSSYEEKAAMESIFIDGYLNANGYLDIGKMKEPISYYYPKEESKQKLQKEIDKSEDFFAETVFKYDYTIHEVDINQMIVSYEAINSDLYKKVDMSQSPDLIAKQLNDNYELSEMKKASSDYLKAEVKDIKLQEHSQQDYPYTDMEKIDELLKDITSKNGLRIEPFNSI